jgi:uncharacterized membrane protein
MRRGQGLQIAAVLALIVGYAGLSHYCTDGAGSRDLSAGARSLGAALALAPLVGLGFALLWRWTRPLIAVLFAALTALLLRAYWPLLAANFTFVYMLQECTVYGLLALSFGRSLRAGAVPYCTRLADRLHGPLTQSEIRYTRQVTAAWTLFFGAVGAVMFILFFAAPLRVWSAFANLCTLPLVVAMFIAEYAVRCRVLPRADRGGILATVRAFLTSPR